MKITEITTETDITRDDLLAAITEGESDLATAAASWALLTIARALTAATKETP